MNVQLLLLNIDWDFFQITLDMRMLGLSLCACVLRLQNHVMVFIEIDLFYYNRK